MRAALGSDWDRIDLHIVVPLSDDFPIQVGDKTLIGSDVERYGSIAVQVEEGLEGDQPADWRGVSLVVPDPESARAEVLVLVGVVEGGKSSEVAGSDDGCF